MALQGFPRAAIPQDSRTAYRGGATPCKCYPRHGAPDRISRTPKLTSSRLQTDQGTVRSHPRYLIDLSLVAFGRAGVRAVKIEIVQSYKMLGGLLVEANHGKVNMTEYDTRFHTDIFIATIARHVF